MSVVSMKLKTIARHKLFQPALSAALTVLCGIALWVLPLGERWRNASYDALFRFTTWPATNRLVLVFMDDEAFKKTEQVRGQPWDRALHAGLLNRLADDGCPLVVMDVFFEEAGEPAATQALLGAMHRLSNVVLMARPELVFHPPDKGRPGFSGVAPVPIWSNFLAAVRGTNWGLGAVNTNRDGVVRQHWKFPSPGLYESLAGTKSKNARAWPSDDPPERWIRYYAPGYAWTDLSYVKAGTQPANFFRDKIVFIGNKPKDNSLHEPDQFLAPSSLAKKGRTNTVAGVEILATEFLNVVNQEWLRRPAGWIEISIFIITGALLGFGLYGRRVWLASALAVGAALAALVGAAWLSHFTNYWFPWLILAGAQVPLAWLFALGWPRRAALALALASLKRQVWQFLGRTKTITPLDGDTLEVPDYEVIRPAFGKGAYGKVWLARNAVGQWQALKAIFRAKFGEDTSPFEREFHGIERYKRVSDQHPGLLRIDFVSRMKPDGYFYYAMELGDPVTPGWEQNPATYKPLDLATKCELNGGRLPVRECVRIGVKLCEALQFLHENGLAHRDIKPRNVIFVKGQAKLADVGLVADAQRPVQDITWVGTVGFMPPEPEPPGTPQADIYGLGVLLYVIGTGAKPTAFPEISSTIVDRNRHPEFPGLSAIILKACQPDRALRYQSAAEMLAALRELKRAPGDAADS